MHYTNTRLTVAAAVLMVLAIWSLPSTVAYTEEEIPNCGGESICVIAVDLDWLGDTPDGEHWAPPPGTGGLKVKVNNNWQTPDVCSVGTDTYCTTQATLTYPCDTWATAVTAYSALDVQESFPNCQ